MKGRDGRQNCNDEKGMGKGGGTTKMKRIGRKRDEDEEEVSGRNDKLRVRSEG